ncbi:MAG TPA: ISNCY family transposase [Candidatus Acidoferrales bacterium]|nr:ISNCY family transposase [Candidatus Acidoferrales bacterium]
MELVTLSSKELHRLDVLRAWVDRKIEQREAARLLGLSVRQIKRLTRRLSEHGPAGLASGHRGRRPNNALDPQIRIRALELYQCHYEGFGPTLAAEKLLERDGIAISRETLRQSLIGAGLWRAGKRKPHPRPPRERRACFGALVQIDGSPHKWFEDRGPRCSLLLAIDDATSCIGAGYFAPAETTNAYFELFERYFTQHGLPEAFYSDRHSIFRINTPLQEDRQTQVKRALCELGIELICANSPQAKGRVERANRTFQDRLVKEMRLRRINTIDEGNRFLPEFLETHNKRFAKCPFSDFNAHRSIGAHNLAHILAAQFERTINANLTIQIDNAIYTLTDSYSRRVLRSGMRIQIHHPRSGTMIVTHNNRRLEYRLTARIERNAAIVNAKDLREQTPKPRSMPQMVRTPAPDHPWKKFPALPR